MSLRWTNGRYPKEVKHQYKTRINHQFFAIAEDKPDIKYLNRHVRSHICSACDLSPGIWKDLGIELMGEDSVADINTISANKRGDVEGCCSSLFALWLQRQPEANWKQLIDALIKIKLNQLAAAIKKLLIPSEQQQTSTGRFMKGTYHRM